MIKLYTNQSFLTETYRRQIFPLLFDLVYKKNETLFLLYKIVDKVEDTDIIVFPIDYAQFIKHKKSFYSLLQLAKTHNKIIWIYTAGDYGFTNYIPNSYTFRLGGFNSKLSNATFVMPSFINDPFLKHLPQGFSALKKEEQPTIGFVGHAQSGYKKYIKELTNHLKYKLKKILEDIVMDSQPFYPSSIKRKHYLSVLEKSKFLKTNFILKNQYRAGVQNEPEKQKSTQEFYNNIFNNAYTFCSRGVGNFSVRFYETLAVGRIPILLDTDCKLPLDNIIDWSKHCAILENKKSESFEHQILKFHNSKSAESFEDIQKNNRLLWETHLIRHVYFIKIHDIFVKQIKINE